MVINLNKIAEHRVCHRHEGRTDGENVTDPGVDLD